MLALKVAKVNLYGFNPGRARFQFNCFGILFA